MKLCKDLFRRLRLSWGWVLAQFIGTLLLVLIGIAWTRLPEKHLWQVALSLFVPLLLLAAWLALQTGTMRRLSDDDGKRVKTVWGALTLLLWIFIAWITWVVLDWCDDRIPQWAGYLNSQSPAHWRATLLTYQHITRWMIILEWVIRWIAMPAKVIPCAVATSQCGLRISWRRVIHLLWNWRWWPVAVIAALASVWLPGHFFAITPAGTVSAQIWHVSLKLAAAFLLAMCSWVLLLGWAAVLFGCQKPLPKNELAEELFRRIRKSYFWIWAQFCWMFLFFLVDRVETSQPGDHGSHSLLSIMISGLIILLLVAGYVLQAGMLRSLLNDGGKQVRMIWGTLAMLIWVVLAVAALLLQYLLHSQFLQWIISSVLLLAVFIPFAAASAVWGLRRLLWQKVLRVLCNWRWWVAVLLAALAWKIIYFLQDVVPNGTAFSHGWSAGLLIGSTNLLEMAIWILLLGWVTVLFGCQKPSEDKAE